MPRVLVLVRLMPGGVVPGGMVPDGMVPDGTVQVRLRRIGAVSPGFVGMRAVSAGFVPIRRIRVRSVSLRRVNLPARLAVAVAGMGPRGVHRHGENERSGHGQQGEPPAAGHPRRSRFPLSGNEGTVGSVATI
jgi:hypothetical protein